jgi:hypothetical protein
VRPILIVAAALALSACHEIPQDAPKSFARNADDKAYAGPMFGGDKTRLEAALAKRAQNQNEYIRMADEKHK